MTERHELIGVLGWEHPPPPGYTGGLKLSRRAWALVAKDLRDHPGQWGVVLRDGGTNSGTTVARISQGLTRWFQPAGSFLAVQRQTNGVVTVYAVYLGDNGEYAEMAGVESVLRAA